DQQPVNKYTIHPAALMFSTMSAEELIELGQDIKANGLREKITLLRPKDGGNPQLLDGRNRLGALQAAGLPTHGDDGGLLPELCDIIDETEGFDPVAFVISKNIHRRHLHLTRAQKHELIEKLLLLNPQL